MGGGRTALDLDEALRLAFGRDPISRLFGASMSGRLFEYLDDPGDFDGFPPVPFEDRVPFDELRELGCYVGLGDAITGLSTVARSVGTIGPYPGMNIRALEPPTGCTNDIIKIVGSGFGQAKPSDAIVVFGSTPADVTDWSLDTEISVRVPDDVSECCVSILQVPDPATGARIPSFLPSPICPESCGSASDSLRPPRWTASPPTHLVGPPQPCVRRTGVTGLSAGVRESPHSERGTEPLRHSGSSPDSRLRSGGRS